MKRPQSPLAIYSSTGLLAATGFTQLLVGLKRMTAKPEADGAAKTVSHGKSRMPCISLYMQVRSPLLISSIVFWTFCGEGSSWLLIKKEESQGLPLAYKGFFSLTRKEIK